MDEFISNPDEKGLLILIKKDNEYQYIDSTNNIIASNEMLELNAGYKHKDFDMLSFFKDDSSGILDVINKLNKDHTYVRLLNVVRDNGMFFIDYDYTDDYIEMGHIKV